MELYIIYDIEIHTGLKVSYPAPELFRVFLGKGFIRLSKDLQEFTGLYKGSEFHFPGSTCHFHNACFCCI